MINFEKFHGIGNDFIIINGIDKDLGNHNALALNVCDRHFGIGADGMIVVEKSDICDIKMLFYNADGTQAPMCGNGIRCFSKFVYDNNILNITSFTVETLAGIMKPKIHLINGKVENVTVNLGRPVLNPSLIPVLSDNNSFIDEEIIIDNKTFNISALAIGSVHAVVFVDDLENIDIKKLGPLIENDRLFPEKINVNFCKIVDNNKIKVLTWERGVGQTLACGTGASAAAFIYNNLKGKKNKVNVQLLGGSVVIEDINNEIHMTGPAKLICKGIYYK